MRGFRFYKCEAAAAALVFTVFPFYFIFKLDHTPAADLRPKRKEKRTARAVCMGAATLDFGFDFYFGFLFTYEVLEHLRTAHHLPGGRFASRGALIAFFLFIPRPHSF
jgi:hypothetical protein